MVFTAIKVPVQATHDMLKDIYLECYCIDDVIEEMRKTKVCEEDIPVIADAVKKTFCDTNQKEQQLGQHIYSRNGVRHTIDIVHLSLIHI